jgi:hypothetical protein
MSLTLEFTFTPPGYDSHDDWLDADRSGYGPYDSVTYYEDGRIIIEGDPVGLSGVDVLDFLLLLAVLAVIAGSFVWLVRGCLQRARAKEEALVVAAATGDGSRVRLLLKQPRANTAGQAMVAAAASGHEAIVRLLLESPRHTPHGGHVAEALAAAAAGGHNRIARLLRGGLAASAAQAAAQQAAAAAKARREVRVCQGWTSRSEPDE